MSTNYTAVGWVDNDAAGHPVSASRLNAVETGIQAVDTAAAQVASVGAVSGIAPLDSSGLVPVANLPISTVALTFLSNGVPSSGLGNNGDYAVDYTTGNVYLKASGAWGSAIDDLGQASNVQIFTTSGTWTKLAAYQFFDVICIGSGASGSAGARFASGQVPTGGGGGGGAAYATARFPASALTSTVTVTVDGTGPTGAVGQVTDSTAGAAGSSGTPTTFGGYLWGDKGFAGSVSGNGVASTGGAGGGGLTNGGTGGASSATGAAGNAAANSSAAPGGGAGGGITAAVAASAGGNGGYASLVNHTNPAGGTVGAGQNGANGVSSGTWLPGTAGGGGASNTTANAGNGGNGGSYGAGGGGGGASLNGHTSGAGGNGAPGLCVVIGIA